ncbi:DUF2334 domain-containing protein [uncultured Maricaulis sp.]|uniref:DUF2334 domain-containing protein n=1 Tax=uncultured Maricaulis sp. TaxID=174710 RepID=UPI0030D935A6|tara:strand:+ start:6291 stop:8048 length:1758 start_codon:yes stop_codon:yes gene_type:complete
MIIRLAILLTAFWGALIYPLHGEISAEPETATVPQRSSVLVLYPDEGEDHELGELHAVNIANLAGRHAEAALQAISQYQPHDRDGHDALIVVNSTYGQSVPAALIDDAISGEGATVWIQPDPASLQASAPGLAAQIGWLAEAATTKAFPDVIYRGEHFTRSTDSTDLVAEVRVTDPDRVEVLAQMQAADGELVPWALRSGALTWVSESPMPFADEDDRYLVFADILSRTLAPDAPGVRQALMRIEDIGPDADPEQIRTLLAAIEALNVPFAATVYDTFVDPNGHFSNGRERRFTLSERPYLASALRDMARAGGTLIMHGQTHQHGDIANPNFGVSGGDYEFFRAGLDSAGRFELLGPLGDDSGPMWDDRIDLAFSHWADAGLPRPWLFTSPHYAASPSAYRSMGERFPARLERVLYFSGEARGDPVSGDELYGEQFFPYPVRDIRGDVILPETLGNWAPDGSIHGRSMEAMLETARRNLVLRDSYASFFFHWYLDPARLTQLTSSLQAMGYEFVSPQVAAAVIPPRAPAGGLPETTQASRAYWAEISSPHFWLRDQIELIILALVLLAHLLVFSIGPKHRRMTAR